MKPNIIVFMTDHQRGDTLKEGSPVITPNINRLRKQAVNFTNAHCPSPHCCPCRASFFSGLYPSMHGIWNNVGVSNALSHSLFDDVKLFPTLLKNSGYDIYLSGKWHVSQTQSPKDFGFELLFHKNKYEEHKNVPDSKEWYHYKNLDNIDVGDEKKTDGRIIRPGYTSYEIFGNDESPYDDKEVVEAAVNKIKTVDKTKPFFLFTGPLGPHDPYFVPQRFLDMYPIEEIELPENFNDSMQDKPTLYRRTKERYAQLSEEEYKETIRHYYAFCSYEDYLFGKLYDAVEENGLMENTLILYMSDHGDYVGSHGLWAKGLPCFREAYDICSMAGGGVVACGGRNENKPISIIDWAPTILKLAGVNIPKKMQGKTLNNFLENKSVDNWNMDCFTQSNGNEVYGIQRCVYNDKWKYVLNTFDYDELYDLENDPNEMKNLLHGIKDFEIPSSKYGNIVKEMCEKLWKFAYDNKDNCVNPYIMTAFAPYGPGIIFDKKSNQYSSK